MSKATEYLESTGTPNNIYTRTAYRVLYPPIRTSLYVGLKTTAFVTRKDPLTLLQKISNKLGLDIEIPQAQ